MDLEHDPGRAARLCGEAHGRLIQRVEQLTTQNVGSWSSLPGWSVGHVLTHLARNADAHARRLTGTLHGVDVPKYRGGEEQRRSEIEDGVNRAADEIIADLVDSCRHLDEVFGRCETRGWPNGDFLGGGHYGAMACPAHRLREIEMHHVDLGLGYTPQDWPDDYVAWDLPVILATVPERLATAAGQRQFMAWLAGRGPLDPSTQLSSW